MELRRAYEQSGETIRPEDYNNFDFIEKKYGKLRKFLPVVIQTLPFTGTLAAKPVLEGIEYLRALDATKRRKLPADAPMEFVDEDWSKAMVTENPSSNGKTGLRKLVFKICKLC